MILRPFGSSKFAAINNVCWTLCFAPSITALCIIRHFCCTCSLTVCAPRLCSASRTDAHSSDSDARRKLADLLQRHRQFNDVIRSSDIRHVPIGGLTFGAVTRHGGGPGRGGGSGLNAGLPAGGGSWQDCQPWTGGSGPIQMTSQQDRAVSFLNVCLPTWFFHIYHTFSPIPL